MLWCETDRNSVAVMVSYDSILRICELCGHKVCRVFGEPNSSPYLKRVRAEQLPVSASASFSMGIFE